MSETCGALLAELEAELRYYHSVGAKAEKRARHAGLSALLRQWFAQPESDRYHAIAAHLALLAAEGARIEADRAEADRLTAERSNFALRRLIALRNLPDDEAPDDASPEGEALGDASPDDGTEAADVDDDDLDVEAANVEDTDARAVAVRAVVAKGADIESGEAEVGAPEGDGDDGVGEVERDFGGRPQWSIATRLHGPEPEWRLFWGLRHLEEPRGSAHADRVLALRLLRVLVDDWNLDAAVDFAFGSPALNPSNPEKARLLRHECLDLIGIAMVRCHALGRVDICRSVEQRFLAGLDAAMADARDHKAALEVELAEARKDAGNPGRGTEGDDGTDDADDDEFTIWRIESDAEEADADCDRLAELRRDFLTILDGSRKPLRFRLNHPNQVANATRLGGRPVAMGTPRRARAAGEAKAAGEGEGAGGAKPGDGTAFEFMPLAFDPPVAPMPADPARIPPPGYGSPASVYRPDQAWEYHEAFYRSRDHRLIRKYIGWRAWSLLQTIVLTEDAPAALLTELHHLAALAPQRVPHFAAIADFLQALEEPARRTRLSRLRELHHRAIKRSFPETGETCLYRARGAIMKSDIAAHLARRRAYRFWPSGGGRMQQFEVSLYPDYVRTVTADEAALDLALRTGNFATLEEFQESIRQRKANRALSEELRSRQESMWEAEAAQDYAKAAELAARNIERAHEIARTAPLHIRELKLVHIYDRLTMALLRLRRYAEAADRLRQMLDLPGDWLRDETPSDLDRLKKRLERAERSAARAARASGPPRKRGRPRKQMAAAE